MDKTDEQILDAKEFACLQNLLVTKFKDCRPPYPVGLAGWACAVLQRNNEPQITFDTSKGRYLLTLAGQTWDITEGMQQIIRFETAPIKKDLQEAEAGAADLRKAVEWMKKVGEFFRYKAPEQIDGNKLTAAMFATAEDALSKASAAGAALLDVVRAAEEALEQFKGRKGPDAHERIKASMWRLNTAMAAYREEKK